MKSTRREEQARQQMQVIQSLVERVHLQGEAAKRKAENDREVKIPKLMEQDNIVSYLTMFERQMAAFEIKREKWAYKLASCLSGKAQKAYAALPVDEAGDYNQLKEAILRRYDITTESYRRRFRTGKRGKEESNKELVTRLHDFAVKWLMEKKTREEVVDHIILEQFLKTLPDDVRVFVQERKPESSEDAAKLANDYLQARKEDLANKESGRDGDKSKKCHQCGKMGHLARDCRALQPSSGSRSDHSSRSEILSGGRSDHSYGSRNDYSTGSRSDHSSGSRNDRSRRDLKDVECFNCHKKGHYSSNCPHNALYCTERRVDHRGPSPALQRNAIAKPGVIESGIVEGKKISKILLDTGCSRTLVHQDLVPAEKILEGEAVAIRCAHGDTLLYPLAQVSMVVDGIPIEVEAAV